MSFEKVIYANDKEYYILKDSGARKEFETGAVRDISEGKGRCDLLPFGIIGVLYQVQRRLSNFAGKNQESEIFEYFELFKERKDPMYLRDALLIFLNKYYDSFYTGILEVSKHYEAGAKKYSENNWKKGIPVHHYLDSATRHLLKFLRGDKDEPHDRAFVWNILGALWTIENKPELNDIEN